MELSRGAGKRPRLQMLWDPENGWTQRRPCKSIKPGKKADSTVISPPQPRVPLARATLGGDGRTRAAPSRSLQAPSHTREAEGRAAAPRRAARSRPSELPSHCASSARLPGLQRGRPAALRFLHSSALAWPGLDSL